MIDSFVRVVTEKVEGGWQVRIVDTDWNAVQIGWTLRPGRYFDCYWKHTFPSRRAAREDLRRYASSCVCTHIIGGLH